MPMPRLEYDAEADALYIYLHEGTPFDHMTTDLERSCNVDYAANGEPIGVEFWNVHRGLDLNGVPERETVTRLLEEHHFKVFA
jgi:uncharacterized protein YuzE